MADSLPSWTDRPAKAAILEFVAAVTRQGGPDFVRPAERIAVFDNDGTLWCEQPAQVQVLFALHRAAGRLRFIERQNVNGHAHKHQRDDGPSAPVLVQARVLR
jgi:hypothetical protein